MKIKTIKIIIGIVVIIAIALIGYSQYKKSTSTEAEKGVIKIGVILPLTVKAASIGEDMKAAIDLAVEEINQKNKVKLEIIYEDEKCDPKEAVSAYQAIRLRGIKLIIGAFCSVSTLSIAPLAEQEKVILITPGSAADAISQAGDFIFRNHVVTMGQKTGKLSEFAAQRFSSIATIYDKSNDAFVLGNKIIIDEFNKWGKTILAVEGFGKETIDFRTQLTKIKAGNPKVIYIGVLMPQAAIIVKQIKELGISSQLIAEDGFIMDTKFLESVGNLAEGLIFSTTDFDRNTNPEFWDLYKKRFSKNPNIVAAQGYDTLKILAKIIEKNCANGDPICVKNTLYNVQNYPGVSGITSFDKNGDAMRSLIIKVVKNGQFVPYEE